MKSKLWVIAAVVGMTSASLQAATVGVEGAGAWGAFTGDVSYDGVSTLTIALTNTSSADNGGYISGFLFNIAGDASAMLTPNPTGWFFDTGDESGQPFGVFEAGAALGADFLGGGQPSKGIGVNQTTNFVFNIAGPAASTLTPNAFLSELSTGGSSSASFLVRFRGFENGQSDKVAGSIDLSPTPTPTVPLPSAIWAGIALLGATSLKRRFWKWV